MTLQGYCGLVRIKTVAVGVFPFLLGVLYAKYRYGTLFGENLLLLFALLTCLAMALLSADSCWRQFAADCRSGVNRGEALAVTGLLLAASAVLGALLVWRTDWAVLPAVLLFPAGVVFSLGLFRDAPALSGVAAAIGLSFLIYVLSVYVHAWELDLYRLEIREDELRGVVSLPELGRLALFALPSAAGIAAILSAGQSRREKRSVGINSSTTAVGQALPFTVLYLSSLGAIPAAVAAGAAPSAYLLSLTAAWPVWKDTAGRPLHKKDGKAAAGSAIRTYIWLESLRLAALAVGIWIGG